LAIGFLASAFGLVALVLIYAKVNGCLPDGPWGDWPNSHGPWHSAIIPWGMPIYWLRTGLDYSFALIIFSVLSSGLSWIIKPGRIKAVIFACGILALILYSKYLYWLVD
jgi:hypothetical protein